MSLIELRIKELPYPEENVFVLFHAKPNDKGCFDGTERVRYSVVVAETAEEALSGGMLLVEECDPGDKTYGFFPLERLRTMGEMLGWSEGRWAVFALSESGLEMSVVDARQRVDVASRTKGFMGAVSGSAIREPFALAERVRTRETLGFFVFSSAEDEALWEAEMERRYATREIQRGVEKRMRMAQEWAEKEEREKRGG